jgi:hypothetical protein
LGNLFSINAESIKGIGRTSHRPTAGIKGAVGDGYSTPPRPWKLVAPKRLPGLHMKGLKSTIDQTLIKQPVAHGNGVLGTGGVGRPPENFSRVRMQGHRD